MATEEREEDEHLYKTKMIEFLGRTTPIILQNDNGPCPLLAICNVLLLKNDLNLDTTSEVSMKTLLTLVANRIMESNSNLENKDAAYVENLQKNIDAAIDRLPLLATGIDVNIRFRRIDDFEFTPECAIFDLLDIPLYHGWIVDPQDYDTANAISSKSYNTLMEKLVALETRHTEGERTSNSEGDCVDFVAATTATLGVPSPCLSRARSFNDSPESVSDHQKRKGDLEEEVELLRALELSSAKLPTSLDEDMLPETNRSDVSVVSDEFAHVKSSDSGILNDAMEHQGDGHQFHQPKLSVAQASSASSSCNNDKLTVGNSSTEINLSFSKNAAENHAKSCDSGALNDAMEHQGDGHQFHQPELSVGQASSASSSCNNDRLTVGNSSTEINLSVPKNAAENHVKSSDSGVLNDAMELQGDGHQFHQPELSVGQASSASSSCNNDRLTVGNSSTEINLSVPKNAAENHVKSSDSGVLNDAMEHLGDGHQFHQPELSVGQASSASSSCNNDRLTVGNSSTEVNLSVPKNAAENHHDGLSMRDSAESFICSGLMENMTNNAVVQNQSEPLLFEHGDSSSANKDDMHGLGGEKQTQQCLQDTSASSVHVDRADHQSVCDTAVAPGPSEGVTSSIDGSEPIYEGEDCILDSGPTPYENQEPMYEGEVVLAEQAERGTGDACNIVPMDEVTEQQGLLIRNFLKSSASQLTIFGLFCLQEGLKERELCVFFRNNHFNTMFKFNGELYLLATDQGYISQPDLVWEKLNEVNGDTVFMTGDFREFKVDNHLNEAWDEQKAMSSTTDFLASMENSEPAGSTLNSDLQLAIALQQKEFENQPQRQHSSQQSSGSSSNSRLITGPQVPRSNASQSPTKQDAKTKDKCVVM